MLNTPIEDENGIPHTNKACWILLLKMKKAYCIWTKHAEYSYWRWTRHTAYEQGMLNTPIEDEQGIPHMNKTCWILLLKMKKSYCIRTRQNECHWWRWIRYTLFEQGILNPLIVDEQAMLYMNKPCCIWTSHAEYSYWRWIQYISYEEGMLNTTGENEQGIQHRNKAYEILQMKIKELYWMLLVKMKKAYWFLLLEMIKPC